jgi:DNA repair photolyase
MKKAPGVLHKTVGRGSAINADHRFSSQKLELDPAIFDHLGEEDRPLLQTQFFKDSSRTILTENDSPDVGFSHSINFYRGCEHGCTYCYARPTHEYLNLSAGLDFESKIFVKEEAPQLLREKFSSSRWQPELVVMSGVTDCYQPAERQFKLARRCLEVFNEFKNPVGIITKNALVTRDIDLLKELAAVDAAMVLISLTTLNPQLSKVMEPRASVPLARLQAIRDLAAAGIPVSVNLAPIVPGLTDQEIPALLKAAAEAGAHSAFYTLLRLPYSVKDLFTEWLEQHFPERKEKVLAAVRDVRGNQLNDSRFGVRMQGEGPYAENVKNLFSLFRKKYGLDRPAKDISTASFRRPGDQLSFL